MNQNRLKGHSDRDSAPRTASSPLSAAHWAAIAGFLFMAAGWFMSGVASLADPPLHPYCALAAWILLATIVSGNAARASALLLLGSLFTLLANLGNEKLLVEPLIFRCISWMSLLIAVLSCGFTFAGLKPAPSRERPGFAMLLASLLLASVLAIASGDAGGPDGMVAWLQRTLGWSLEAAELSTVVFRKCVHFVFFGVLAWLGLRAALAMGVPLRRAVFFALLWSATFAAFDEVSQLASPARTGSALDFVLDMLGAVTFVWLTSRKRAKIQATSLQPREL